MFNRKITTLVAVFTIMAIATPAFALASNGDSKRGEDRKGVRSEQSSERTNQFGVHENENEDESKHGDHDNHGLMLGMMYKGTVTAESANGFTIQTRDNTTFTVIASSAKIITIPRTEIPLADISVGDKVYITGTKTGSTITASVVYDMPVNVKPGKAKGTVTAVNGNTITVQTKDNKTVTVNMDQDTKITTASNQPGTTADVQVGSKVKAFGLWNSILNVFNAIRIRIK